MNNLRKFATEADYSAATLNYPAVSWVVSGDTLHYDLSGDTPTPSAPAIKIAFAMDECGNGKEMHVEGNGDMINNGFVTAITVNDVELTLSSSMLAIELEANTDYLIEYYLSNNATYDNGYFFIETPWGCASSTISYDMLFPSQIEHIGGLNEKCISKLIVEATTPPYIYLSGSDFVGQIYVPDSAVNTYKTDENWSGFASAIHPISEYSGNIPV